MPISPAVAVLRFMKSSTGETDARRIENVVNPISRNCRLCLGEIPEPEIIAMIALIKLVMHRVMMMAKGNLMAMNRAISELCQQPRVPP